MKWKIEEREGVALLDSWCEAASADEIKSLLPALVGQQLNRDELRSSSARNFLRTHESRTTNGVLTLECGRGLRYLLSGSTAFLASRFSKLQTEAVPAWKVSTSSRTLSRLPSRPGAVTDRRRGGQHFAAHAKCFAPSRGPVWSGCPLSLTLTGHLNVAPEPS